MNQERNFRARALDHNRPLPIWLAEDLHEQTDFYGQATRAVVAIPTGVDKDEEQEIHLKEALEQKNCLGRSGSLCFSGFEDSTTSFIDSLHKSLAEIDSTLVIPKKQSEDDNKTHIPVPEAKVEVDELVQIEGFKKPKHYYKHNQVSII